MDTDLMHDIAGDILSGAVADGISLDDEAKLTTALNAALGFIRTSYWAEVHHWQAEAEAEAEAETP
jgi:hypothetical protein